MMKTALSLCTLYTLTLCQHPPVIPSAPVIPEQPAVPIIPVKPKATVPVTPKKPITTTQSTTLEPVVSISTTTKLAEGQTYGAYGQICAVPSVDAQCKTTSDYAIASQSTKCEKDFDCCMCSTVQCTNCNIFSVGNWGVFGVKSVLISGRDIEEGGSDIFCKGTAACTNSVIQASNIKAMACSKEMSCKNATITIINPANHFYLNCIGTQSCNDLTINVVINPPAGGQCDPSVAHDKLKIAKIACVGTSSCEGLDFRLSNNGCGKVEIENFDCEQNDACGGANFNFIGDIDIATCHCGESCQTVTGIDKCFDNLEYLYCPDPVSCNGAMRTITNPIDGFILKCSATASCQGAIFSIVVNEFSSGVDMFDGLMCNGPHACDGATFIIHNQQQSGNVIEIEKIECSSVGSCMNTMFIVGDNVNIGQIYCNPTSCEGCVIKKDPNEPGMPCDPKAKIQNIPQVPAIPAVSV